MNWNLSKLYEEEAKATRARAVALLNKGNGLHYDGLAGGSPGSQDVRFLQER
jgi:hypothetical protein